MRHVNEENVAGKWRHQIARSTMQHTPNSCELYGISPLILSRPFGRLRIVPLCLCTSVLINKCTRNSSPPENTILFIRYLIFVFFYSAENSTYAFFMESTSIEYYKERHCDLLQVGDLLDSKSYGIGMKRSIYISVINIIFKLFYEFK